MQERRQSERVTKNLSVRYSRLEDLVADEPHSQGELVDISSGGLCFVADAPVVLGSQLVIILEFPGWQTAEGKWVATKQEQDVGVLQVIGMVVWVAKSRDTEDKYDIGVRFSGTVGVY